MVWTTVEEANEALEALKTAKRVLSREEYEKFKRELIEIALKSYTKPKIHFFEYLPSD